MIGLLLLELLVGHLVFLMGLLIGCAIAPIVYLELWAAR
jgi:hypothetical protein